MDNLVVNPAVQNILGKMSKDLPQGLLLEGIEGVGLLTIARSLSPMISFVIGPTDSKGESDRNGTIGVEQIRELRDLVKGKSVNIQAIIIDDADKMTLSSQNAFLKLLEEPNRSTRFILTTHHKSALLPTVLSRVRQINIPPATPRQSKKMIEDLPGLDNQSRAQISFLASGLPAKISRLQSDTKELMRLGEIVNDAKIFLANNRYDMLVRMQKYSSSRQTAVELVETLLSLSRHLLPRNTTKRSLQRIDQLVDILEALNSNSNQKLQLLRLVV